MTPLHFEIQVWMVWTFLFALGISYAFLFMGIGFALGVKTHMKITQKGIAAMQQALAKKPQPSPQPVHNKTI